MGVFLLLAAVTAAAPGGVEVRLTAERLVHEGGAQRTTAEGAAHLETEGAALDADRVVYDAQARAATAAGHVALRLTRGSLVAVTADVVTLRFDDEGVAQVFFLDGRAMTKADTTPEALWAARTPAELETVGRTTALLSGNTLTREGRRWRAEALDLVPCECDFANPSWRIRASSATFDTEAERVSVVGPTVYVQGLPVLWLPWLSLPMTERQSGLLFPKPAATALNGFSLEQPVFVTLGRSADVTLTPGYFFGGDGVYGVRGPRLNTEVRWAPAEGASGRLNLGLLYDLRDQRDPIAPSLTVATPRGVRGELGLAHRQAFGHGFEAAADVNLFSDSAWQRDVTTDVIAREQGYLRSTAAVQQRGLDHLVGLEAVVRQDLTWGFDPLGNSPGGVHLGSGPAFGPGTLQRLPAVRLALPARPVLGPVTASLDADVARLAPLWGPTGDEGADANEGRLFDAVTGEELRAECLRLRLYAPGLADASCGAAVAGVGRGDRLWQPGEREPRLRLHAFPKLAVAVTPGEVVSLSAFAALRQTLWSGEASGTVGQRGYPVLGARAETALTRTFGEGTLRHEIVPAVEVRSVPLVWGGDPAPYDEVDTALRGTTAVHQAAVTLGQRLLTRANGAVSERIFVELGQGVHLGSTVRAGESWARARVRVGPFAGDGQARLEPTSGRLTRLAGSAALEGDGRRVYARYDRLLDDGSDWARRPLDLLVGPPVPASATSTAQLLSFGASWRFGDLGVRYDAVLYDRAWPQADGSSVTAFTLMQHGVGLSYAPACDCWRVEVVAVQRPHPTTGQYGWPDVGLTLTVSRFGSIGAGP